MTQTHAILAHLKRHGMITPLRALYHYGCLRLAARIAELRAAGHVIETELAQRGRKRWAVYRLRRGR